MKKFIPNTLITTLGLLFLQVLADPGLLAKSYLGKSALCKPWTCIQHELELRDSLPPRNQILNVLETLLPKDVWQDAITPTLDTCYGDPPRIYTNTCPGQALWHCIIDNLNENCPEQYLMTDDVCAPISSLAGLKYMFAQSRYPDFEKNSKLDKRPVCYLKSYYNSKCCYLPKIFSQLLLSECKFSTMLRTNMHGPEKRDDVSGYLGFKVWDKTNEHSNQGSLHQCSASYFHKQAPKKDETETPPPPTETTTVSEPWETQEPQKQLSYGTFESMVLELQNGTKRNNATNKTQEKQKEPHMIESTSDHTTENQQLTNEITSQTDKDQPFLVHNQPGLNAEEISMSSLIHSYTESELCKPWICLNSKLKIKDFPSMETMTNLLHELLPEKPWNDVIKTTIDTCFEDPPRRYTNTCPGQGLWHCLIDVFSENCPNDRLIKEDACAPIGSLAGLNYMFSQSRYTDFQNRLLVDTRPVWFLRNYFSSKCCRLPTIFNRSLLNHCGFSTMITTYLQTPVKHQDLHVYSRLRVQNDTVIYHRANDTEEHHKKTRAQLPYIFLKIADPLDCCDMTNFLLPATRQECDFKIYWDRSERLIIDETPVMVSSTPEPSERKERNYDVTVVPLACELETCVFRKLKIVKRNGKVSTELFSQLLDNMTDIYPEWRKAKARVNTKCLSKPINLYEDDCEINKILACTFDVLSENCPYAKQHDPCKNSLEKDDMTCQVSSSIYRPKRRRQYCGIPSFVSHKVLSKCRLNSISDLKYVPVSHTPVNASEHKLSKQSCKEMTSSTQCVLNKIGILNKYGFMDYFKMKGWIRSISLDDAWSPKLELYESALLDLPLYSNHCNSPKRFLNVIDIMLTTCPETKRKTAPFCDKLFKDLNNTLHYPKSEQDVYPLLKLFEPEMPLQVKGVIKSKTKSKIIINPPFDFGILNSGNAPAVEIIDVNPGTKPTDGEPANTVKPPINSEVTMREFIPFNPDMRTL